MGFKETVRTDIFDVFLNTDEFADIHTVDGKEIRAVLDDDLYDGTVSMTLHGQSQERVSGLYSGGKAMYVSAAEMKKPKTGTTLEVDGTRYKVRAVSEQDGMYKINLEHTNGR